MSQRVLDILIKLTGSESANRQIQQIAKSGGQAAAAMEMAQKKADLFVGALGQVNPMLGGVVQQGQQFYQLLNGQLGPQITKTALEMGVAEKEAIQMGQAITVAGKAAGLAALAYAGFHVELKAIQATMGAMSRGGSLLGQQAAFGNILGTQADSTLRMLRESTEGTIATSDLRSVGVLGFNADLTTQQMDRLTDGINDLSAAYGQELLPMLQQHIPNAAAGAFRSLKQFGLGVEDIAELEAHATDKTEAYIQAVEKLAAKVGPGQDGAADAVDALHAAQKNLTDGISVTIAKFAERGGLVSLANSLADGLHNSADGSDLLADGLRNIFVMTPPGWLINLIGLMNGGGATSPGGGYGTYDAALFDQILGRKGAGNRGPHMDPMSYGYMSQDAEGNPIWVPGANPVDKYNANTSYVTRGGGGSVAPMSPVSPMTIPDAMRRMGFSNRLIQGGARSRATEFAALMRGQRQDQLTDLLGGMESIPAPPSHFFALSQLAQSRTPIGDAIAMLLPAGQGRSSQLGHGGNVGTIADLIGAGVSGGASGVLGTGAGLVLSNTLSAASMLGAAGGPIGMMLGGLLGGPLADLFGLGPKKRETIKEPSPVIIENPEAITGPLNRTILEALRLIATGGQGRLEQLAARQGVGF